MPRKGKKTSQTTQSQISDAATAIAEPETPAIAEAARVPSWIDGPPTTLPEAHANAPREPDARNWGDPYKSIVSTAGFEMGEHRRFNQRVFRFIEKPTDAVLATLKNAGFTYRANEKAWTIPANPDTRRLSDELARTFAGPGHGAQR